MRLPGMGFMRASWSAYITQKGVMKPTTSAGSNQRGDSVTYSAQHNPQDQAPFGIHALSLRSTRTVSERAPQQEPSSTASCPAKASHGSTLDTSANVWLD